ncbi:MAG: glycosyltransferase family 4 protein [Candidatus Paceibacterota bacterium]|jgi:glycosyltransferase involved in cell wall biosynthesis
MQEKKKILYVITKGNFGGAQRYVYDLATSLPKEKFEVLVAHGEGQELSNLLKEKQIKSIKLDKLVREVKFFDEFKVCKELIRLIRFERPDVIHLNSSKIGGVGAVAGTITQLLEKNYRPKIIFTAHNWGFNDNNRSSFEKLFYYMSHWITLMLCHQVIAVSEKTKKDVCFLPLIKGKITVIYNGIDNFEILSKTEARSILAGLKTDKTIIFSISELHKNKGLDLALRAIALLPKEAKEKIIYAITGDGEEKENLKNLAKELGIENIINFLGFVPNAKKLLAGSDIFMLSSRTEAFPYVILEAGFIGLPIIATSVGGIPEVIKDMQNGILVHPQNPKEIAEAILYLLDHPEKSQEFGEEIKKTISNFFSLEKMLNETIRLYQ